MIHLSDFRFFLQRQPYKACRPLLIGSKAEKDIHYQECLIFLLFKFCILFITKLNCSNAIFFTYQWKHQFKSTTLFGTFPLSKIITYLKCGKQEFVWTNIQKCVSRNVFRLHVGKNDMPFFISSLYRYSIMMMVMGLSHCFIGLNC